MGSQTDSEARLREDYAQVLIALVRAHHDVAHRDVEHKGLEERDLAFESGMLSPAEMELTVYATQKRGRVLRLLREMETRGWVSLQQAQPSGAYRVFLRNDGVQALREHLRPWWSRLWKRLRRQG